MPYDVAFTLPPSDVATYAIIFGEFEGNKFDWINLRWINNDKA